MSIPNPNTLILTEAGSTNINGTYTRGIDVNGFAAWYKEGTYRIIKLSEAGGATWAIQQLPCCPPIWGNPETFNQDNFISFVYMQTPGPSFTWQPFESIPNSPVGLIFQTINGSIEPGPIITAGISSQQRIKIHLKLGQSKKGLDAPKGKRLITGTSAFNSSGVLIANITGNIPQSWVSSSSVRSVTFANNNSITTIGNNAFYNNQLTSVTIPNGVTTIGSYAFSSNPLTSVTIPGSVTSIGSYAFLYNSLTSVTISNGYTTIGSYAFAYNYTITSVTIPNGVTTIGSYAFSSNLLTSVTIPGSVTSIANGTFYNNQLTSVAIPNKVTSIGSNAFAGNSLTSVTIPGSVTSIESYAFAWNRLTSVTIPNSVTTIGSNAFFDAFNSLSSVNCYTTQTAFTSNDALRSLNAASPLTIRVRATDNTWTAGTGLTFQGRNNVTVIKDL